MTRAEVGPPPPGEVLFEVERFGFSANNVTYALLGDALRYWDLFPAEPGWGQIPDGTAFRVHKELADRLKDKPPARSRERGRPAPAAPG